MREEIYSVYGQSGGGAFTATLAGVSYCDGSYHILRRRSTTFCIEYIMEGSGTVTLDGRSYRAEKGDVYMLLEGHDHNYYSDADTPWTKVWFNATGSLIDTLAAAYGLENEVLFKQVDLSGYFDEVLTLCKSGGETERINDGIAVIFHRMLQRLCRERKALPRQGEAGVLREHIDRNLAKPMSIEGLAGMIYKSPSQTIRIFKREYGVTPYEYLIKGRLSLAKQLLTGTTMQVKEIAYQCGFEDEHYFSSVFRRRCGVSPRRYRENGQR